MKVKVGGIYTTKDKRYQLQVVSIDPPGTSKRAMTCKVVKVFDKADYVQVGDIWWREISSEACDKDLLPVKPVMVEGWVNVYRSLAREFYCGYVFYKTQKAAKNAAKGSSSRQVRVRFEAF